MTTNILFEAINLIDDDMISSAYEKPSKRVNIIRYSALAAAFGVVLVAAFGLVKHMNGLPTGEINSPASSSSEKDAYGGLFFPDEINSETYTTSGKPFTKEEIRNYVESRKTDIIGGVAAEYGDFESEYRICISGYNHITLGKENVMKLDFVDLPICKGDEIVAMLTLFRTDGKINQTISLGGDRWQLLNEIYSENPNCEIAYFYYGFIELAVTPTNHIYNLQGANHSLEIDKSIDYYGNFATEYNTFSLEEMTNEDNYISVVPELEVNLAESFVPEIRFDNTDETTGTGLAETTQKPTVNIYVEDLLSKEITAIEYGDSYDILLERPFEKCTDEQAERVCDYISAITPSEAAEIKQYYGGSCIIRLVYDDGTRAYVVIQGDNQLYFETSKGMSPVYTDLSSNAEKIVNYILQLK